MCGVIGYRGKNSQFAVTVIKELLLQSQIRGKHATGISYLDNDKVVTEKEPISAEDFVLSKVFKNIEPNRINHLTLIGHCRYSTSDLKYNQPIANSKMAIAHNGVITQSSPDKWEEQYNYRCETKNDSELLFRCLEMNYHPLFDFENASIACTAIQNGKLLFFRNGQRPLWYFEIKDGIFVASTKDIFVRTFGAEYEYKKCNPNTIYTYDKKLSKLKTDSPIIEDLQTETKIQSFYKKVEL